MRVIELMERVGLRDGQRAMAYIKDGLLEVSQQIPEQTKRFVFSVVSGTRYYNLPSDFVTMRGVYRLWDSNGKYVKIPRVQHVEILQDSASATATSDDDLIVI